MQKGANYIARFVLGKRPLDPNNSCIFLITAPLNASSASHPCETDRPNIISEFEIGPCLRPTLIAVKRGIYNSNAQAGMAEDTLRSVSIGTTT